MRFRWRKALQLVLKVSREIFIGKAAAVIGAWVFKNALFMSILTVKAKSLGTTPDKVYDPKYIKAHNLEFEFLVFALATFLILLFCASGLGYWAQASCGPGGAMGSSCFQRDWQRIETAGELTLTRQVTASIGSVLASDVGTESLDEMRAFYKAGLAFLPAWAYKDFIERLLVVLTDLYARPFFRFIGTESPSLEKQVAEENEKSEDAAAALIANLTAAEENQENATDVLDEEADSDLITEEEEEEEADGNLIAEMDDDGMEEEEEEDFKELEEEGESTSGNMTNSTGPVVVEKIEEVVERVRDPLTAWNICLALCATILAATLGVNAHTWAENLGDGRCDFLKVVCNSLQTCMGLGTGFAFWNIFSTIFAKEVLCNMFWRTVYAVAVTVCVSLAQIQLRRCEEDSPDGSCILQGFQFLDRACNFVIAWAWNSWLTEAGFMMGEVVLGKMIKSCDGLVFELRFLFNAWFISFIGVMIVASLTIFDVNARVKDTATLITGINAGWAWMHVIISYFACDFKFTIFNYWKTAVLVVTFVAGSCLLLELTNHLLDMKIKALREEAGTLAHDEPGYFDFHDQTSDSSEDDDDDDYDDDSEDDSDSDGKQRI